MDQVEIGPIYLTFPNRLATLATEVLLLSTEHNLNFYSFITKPSNSKLVKNLLFEMFSGHAAFSYSITEHVFIFFLSNTFCIRLGKITKKTLQFCRALR